MTESPTRRARFLTRLRTFPTSVALVFALLFGMHLGRYLQGVGEDYYPGGDGYYIYMVARSLAFDGDFSFENEYRTCGDPWTLGYDYGTGVSVNPYYVGPATIWAPALWVIRHVVPLPPSPRYSWSFGCRGRYLYALGMLGPVFGTLTAYLAYRCVRRFVERPYALLAAVITSTSLGLETFATLWWNYSHVWAAFTLGLVVLATFRLHEARESWSRYAVLGAFIGWAALMRPHHGVWLLVPALFTVQAMWPSLRAHRVPWAAAGRGLLALAAFCAVFSLRLYSHQVMYGTPWPPTVGAIYLQPSEAHPLLVLFSSRAGLFAQHPLAWLSAVGFFLSLRSGSGRPAFVSLAVAFLADLFVCSIPMDWSGGATVGPRLLVSFAPYFGVLAGLALAEFAARVDAVPGRAARWATVLAVLPLATLSWGLVDLEAPDDMPTRYGKAFRRLATTAHEYVGNPFTFPGTAVYALRYGVAPRTFDTVAQYGFFVHDLHTARELLDKTLYPNTNERRIALGGRGEIVDEGLALVPNADARLVFPMAWPRVTTLRVKTNDPPTNRCWLRVTHGSFFVRTYLATRHLRAGGPSYDIRVQANVFDSGINELVFHSNCAVVVTSLTFEDTSPVVTETTLTRSRRPIPRRPAPAP